MNQARDEIIRCRLNKMAEWAKQRRDFLVAPPKGWKKDWYIRIGGNGFTAVSVNDESPQIGFNPGAKPRQEISKLLDDFKRTPVPPRRKTPEKRIQSLLIRQAINQQEDMKELKGLGYDRLLFALDEVALGDPKHPPKLVCDILAIGVQGSNAYPVLIELKSSHQLIGKHGLLGQLQDYQVEMKEFKPEFEALLNNCVNREVDFSKCVKVIIWPRLPSGKVSEKTFDECKKESVGIIQYTWDHRSDIENIKFESYPGLKMTP